MTFLYCAWAKFRLGDVLENQSLEDFSFEAKTAARSLHCMITFKFEIHYQADTGHFGN